MLTANVCLFESKIALKMATLCLGPVCIPIWHVLAIIAFLFGPLYRWFQRRRGILAVANIKEDSLQPTKRHEVLPVKEVTSWENVAKILETVDVKKAFCPTSPERHILVKYSAEWCKPCKMIQPFVEKMNKCFWCLMFVVDISKSQDMADVNCMPTFRLYTWNPNKSPLIKDRPGLGMTLSGEVMGANTQGILQMLATHCKSYDDSQIVTKNQQDGQKH